MTQLLTLSALLSGIILAATASTKYWKIRHMAALGCKYIVLDHLSIVVSDQSAMNGTAR